MEIIAAQTPAQASKSSQEQGRGGRKGEGDGGGGGERGGGSRAIPTLTAVDLQGLVGRLSVDKKSKKLVVCGRVMSEDDFSRVLIFLLDCVEDVLPPCKVFLCFGRYFRAHVFLSVYYNVFVVCLCGGLACKNFCAIVDTCSFASIFVIVKMCMFTCTHLSVPPCKVALLFV